MRLTRYQELIERIHDELVDLDRAVHRAQTSWRKAKLFSGEDAFIDSAALNLQSFYTGLERIFEQVVRGLGQALPTGEDWHQKLLTQISEDVPGLRPAVINRDLVARLDEFRKFRHVIRNIYTTNINPGRMQVLFDLLPTLWPQVKQELLSFADFLQVLDESENTP